MKIYKLYLVLSIFAMLAAPACKKDKNDEGGPSANGTREELTKDSIFLYAKETYLWNDALPSYEQFNPRGFANFNGILTAFATYQPLDKYSFLDDGSLADELGGVSGDYGFAVNYNDGNPLDLRINYVYENSPAGTQGVKRGYQITKLNGRTELDGRSQANIDHIVNAVFGAEPSVSMTLKKFDGTSVDVTVTRGTYSINPVLFSNVYSAGAKKIGYLVFNSFTTNTVNRLTAVMADFANQGVSELIIDLRYNGGGSVATAEALTNLIAPASENGSVMFTTYYNQIMQSNGAAILANQPLLDENGKLQPYTEGVNGKYATYADLDFSPTRQADNQEVFEKTGNLNVSRVYFIVTGATASASELVINNLKPVLDVRLIGRRTFGKPVGFFGIHIDKYDLYIPQFETKNKDNQGEYYQGMIVDQEDYDDISKEFGNPSERYLSYALGHSQSGSFPAVSVATISSTTKKRIERMSREESMRVTNELDKTRFKGMVESKRNLNR